MQKAANFPGWVSERVLPRFVRGRRIRVSSVESAIVDHCNLKCAGCDHASPHLPERFVEPEELTRDLRALAKAIHAEEFRLVGGEPLLHPQLEKLVDIVRESRISDELTLISNGVRLHDLSPSIWDKIDRLWLSEYPGVRLRLSVPDIAEKCSQHGVTFIHRPTSRFRQVALFQEVGDDELVDAIYANCKAAHVWKCYTVADGYFYKCAKPPTVAKRLSLVGKDYQPRHPDGVSLHDRGSLRSRLERYLESQVPLGACHYCLGSDGPDFGHRQLNRQEIASERNADRSEAIVAAGEKICGS